VLVAGPPDPDEDEVLGQVRTYLDGRPDLPVMEYLGPQGARGAVLPELGAGAQLLVLGSRGRGGFGGLLLGSNGMAAARDADCPVVVVPRPGREVHGETPSSPDPGWDDGDVVGLHMDSPDDTTLAFAFAEAALRRARLQVVAAYPWPPQTWASAGEPVPPVIDQDAVENETRVLTEPLLAPHHKDHPAVRVEPYVAPGDAAGHLVAAAKDADLVVVGRHRRRLPAPARLIGSVIQAVPPHAASPVAVVPPKVLEE
jgi:nucleotide-binding universal stress UspA family protein